MLLYEDNQAAIAIASNPVYHRRTKHIDVRHHFVRDAVVDGKVVLNYIATNDNLADLLTKALARDRFHMLGCRMGLFDAKKHPSKEEC